MACRQSVAGASDGQTQQARHWAADGTLRLSAGRSALWGCQRGKAHCLSTSKGLIVQIVQIIYDVETQGGVPGQGDTNRRSYSFQGSFLWGSISAHVDQHLVGEMGHRCMPSVSIHPAGWWRIVPPLPPSPYLTDIRSSSNSR